MEHGLCGTCAFWARDASGTLDEQHPKRPEKPMSVRAKFKVDAIERTAHNSYPHKTEEGKVDYGRPERGELHTIVMSPVYGNNDPNHENTKFWSASPSGSLRLGTVNPDAVKQFELGREYYIEFTPAG